MSSGGPLVSGSGARTCLQGVADVVFAPFEPCVAGVVAVEAEIAAVNGAECDDVDVVVCVC